MHLYSLRWKHWALHPVATVLSMCTYIGSCGFFRHNTMVGGKRWLA